MKNILSILLAVYLCISFSACSSGDYSATPSSSGTTINKNNNNNNNNNNNGNNGNNGNNNNLPTAFTGSGNMSAIINGTSWASNSAISIDTGGALQELVISGGNSSTSQIVGLQIGSYTGVGTYSSTTNSFVQVVYDLNGTPTAAASSTITVTTSDSLGWYIGTFSATTSLNSSFIVSGQFSVKL